MESKFQVPWHEAPAGASMYVQNSVFPWERVYKGTLQFWSPCTQRWEHITHDVGVRHPMNDLVGVFIVHRKPSAFIEETSTVSKVNKFLTYLRRLLK